MKMPNNQKPGWRGAAQEARVSSGPSRFTSRGYNENFLNIGLKGSANFSNKSSRQMSSCCHHNTTAVAGGGWRVRPGRCGHQHKKKIF